jgi:biotin carboxyl carrier protein
LLRFSTDAHIDRGPDRMRYFVTIAGREIEVDLTGAHPVVDGTPVEAHLAHLPGTDTRHLLVDGRSYALEATAGERRGRWSIGIGAERFTADAVDERTRAIREMTGAGEDVADKTIVAPMPGLVLKVEVEVGQGVRAGQGVIVVEAMKMENELKAPSDGVVASISVQPGQTVDKGATLIVLE